MNQTLIENNYLFVPQFIPFDRAKTLAASFEDYVVKNNCGGDPQIPESNSTYGFVEFDELLCEKISTVGWLAGESVLPTYTYARVYHKNAELKIHKDRGACEVSLTVNLDQDGVDWPISIKKPDGSVATLNLKPGDAMLYLGCIAEHWREPFQGEKHTQVFFHYVRSRGPNAKFAFDKNKDNLPEVSFSKAGRNPVIVDPCKVEWSPTHIEELSKYIILIKDALSPELCKKIILEYKDSNEWRHSTVGSESTLAPDIRGAHIISISAEEALQKNSDIRKLLDQEIHQGLTEAIQMYKMQLVDPEIGITIDTGYDLLRYSDSAGYTQHIDNFTTFPRTVSCSILLNDEFNGGEFFFFNKAYSVKLTAGSMLFFPSNFLFPHGVAPVTNGTRYSIVTWFR